MVNEDPRTVDELLQVLRKHGVAKYQRGGDGSLCIELHTPEAGAGSVYAPPVYEPTAAPAPALEEPPPAEGEAPEVAPAPRLAAGHKPVFAGMKSNDPLFDHVEGNTP